MSSNSGSLPKPQKPLTEKKLKHLRSKADLRQDWQTILQPQFSTMHKITDELYLTGLFGLTLENLTNNKIKTIINATSEAPNNIGYDTLRILVDDDRKENIYPHLSLATDKIHETTLAGGRTVVHCMAGVSRSTAIVLAYLIKYRKWTLRRAYKHVVQIREVARPNSSFLKQLVIWERQLIGTCSTQIVREKKDDVIIEMPDFLKKDLPDKYEAEFESNRAMNRIMSGEPEEPPPGPLLHHFTGRALTSPKSAPAATKSKSSKSSEKKLSNLASASTTSTASAASSSAIRTESQVSTASQAIGEDTESISTSSMAMKSVDSVHEAEKPPGKK
ncbi:Dual specificity protein phosphatase 21 [Halotydeus destructor]|nr:Dual specificity protein phosphatase 21 [Halotydeus destructor]